MIVSYRTTVQVKATQKLSGSKIDAKFRTFFTSVKIMGGDGRNI